MYNYWTEKIALKTKITKDLMPKLKGYIGQEIKNDTVGIINVVVMDWLDEIGEMMFTCEIKIDVENKNGKVFVKAVAVTPLDD